MANTDPLIDSSGITFNFVAPGIEIQDLSGGVTGSKARFVKSIKYDPLKITVGIYGASTPGGALFYGSHQPLVQMKLPSGLTVPCAPIDPIITNSDN